jgi:protein-S-isoprenylcysteine O-methyltransferase Ste14
MLTFYRLFFPALWSLCLACLWLLSLRSKPTERVEGWRSWLLHTLPLGVAVLLLALPHVPGGPLLNQRLLRWAPWQFWGPAALTVAGLGLALWARVHLGRNGSVAVTLKRGHELVTTGPYAWMRHPLYTGLLLAFLGSALALGQGRGLLALLIAALTLRHKWRLEERWMRERFGLDYEAYARRVPALLPFARP